MGVMVSTLYSSLPDLSLRTQYDRCCDPPLALPFVAGRPRLPEIVVSPVNFVLVTEPDPSSDPFVLSDVAHAWTYRNLD